jgi:hypothetical protein
MAKLQAAVPVCEIGDGEESANPAATILADQEPTMSKKTRTPSFDQVLDTLRAHSFDVAPYAGVAGGVVVSKHGAGAVLVPGPQKDAPLAFAIHPGALVKGEVARLLDRGYQKFLKTSQYELPASASQLHAIHEFTEELKLLLGDVSLYNESLGTTSDVYEYDRLEGREAVTSAPARPWELGGGH